MKTSATGRALIEQREGRKLRAYRDSVGVLTIGVGHTGRMAAPKVTAGMIITSEECDAFLAADLAPVEGAIAKALKVPATQNEFDAMASLWFNAGIGYVKMSAIVRRLNLGDVAGAATGFDAYHKPAAIIGRRNGEKAQFLERDAAAAPVIVARAGVLATHAAKASATAKKATVAAAAGPSFGVVAAGLAATHHPAVAATVGLSTLLLSAASGVFGWLQQHKAQTLAANAATHLG